MRIASGRTIASAILILALAGCAALPPRELDDALAAVNRALDRLERRGLTGQVLILQAENTLLSRGLGRVSPESDRAVSADSVMPLASVSKPFTASAILALAADGRLALTDPLGDHLPELSTEWQAATIEQLLTHTAGLPAEIFNPAWDGPPRFEPISRAELIRRVNQFVPDHPPGERFNYSNIGYNLAAALIERISGQPPEIFLVQRLLEPVGIEDLGLLGPGWQEQDLVVGRRGRSISGHHLDQPRRIDGLGWHSRGSGDLLARPEAMAAWWRRLRDGGWLPEPWLEAFLSPQVEAGDDDSYGFGLEFRTDRHGRAVGHTGSDLDFSIVWSWYPEHDLMIYVALADSRWRADQLSDSILGQLITPM